VLAGKCVGNDVISEHVMWPIEQKHPDGQWPADVINGRMSNTERTTNGVIVGFICRYTWKDATKHL